MSASIHPCCIVFRYPIEFSCAQMKSCLHSMLYVFLKPDEHVKCISFLKVLFKKIMHCLHPPIGYLTVFSFLAFVATFLCALLPATVKQWNSVKSCGRNVCCIMCICIFACAHDTRRGHLFVKTLLHSITSSQKKHPQGVFNASI